MCVICESVFCLPLRILYGHNTRDRFVVVAVSSSFFHFFFCFAYCVFAGCLLSNNLSIACSYAKYMMNPLSAGSLDANAKRKTTLFARRPEERTRPGPSFPCICLLLNIYTTLVKFVQPDRSWHFAHLAYEI